nr:hypothetical protein [Tanacetum cinerariifolium]
QDGDQDGEDVAQVANAARNYETLHERDDDDAERPGKRQKSGDRHQLTTQQSSHRNHGECRRAAGTCFKYGQTGHMQKDFQKNTAASTSGQADKKPVFVLFDTGATHFVISSIFASCVTTTPTLLDHVLCISTPMKDSVRITHVYRDLPLQFDDKIREINAIPFDMYEFDIILEHHAMIDCHSYRVIFGDVHAPEYTYHGSLPGKSMQIISALQARTLLYHGCEDVFPDELPGIPLVREVEFNIKLIP